MININEFLNTVIDDCLLINGDCLKVMDKLIEQNVKVDAIITDIPYQITACKWDKMIPFEDMWHRLNQLIKDNSAIALFGSEPFSSALRMSNIKHYKYDWIWNKIQSTSFGLAKKQPMRTYEIISIFYKQQCNYNPIMTPKDRIIDDRNWKSDGKSENSKFNSKEKHKFIRTESYPKNIITINSTNKECNNLHKLHPTQKPIELMEYLIKTYTNKNELVLDFTAGSFSTGVACQNTNRKFIGIELEEKYYNIGIERITNNSLENKK